MGMTWISWRRNQFLAGDRRVSVCCWGRAGVCRAGLPLLHEAMPLCSPVLFAPPGLGDGDALSIPQPRYSEPEQPSCSSRPTGDLLLAHHFNSIPFRKPGGKNGREFHSLPRSSPRGNNGRVNGQGGAAAVTAACVAESCTKGRAGSRAMFAVTIGTAHLSTFI